ncbi:MAG TPA: sulfotransferase [Sphingomonas sp.]|jgi:hypothetical protein
MTPPVRLYEPAAAEAAMATVSAARATVDGASTRRVAPKDFELTRPVATGAISPGHALPYCWNLPNRELLCTLHDDPAPLFGRPFLYGAQRATAREVAAVPFARLDGLFEPHDADARFIFVLSPGRVGSTLLQALLRCAVPRTVSEPDALTQLVPVRGKWAKDAGLRRSLFWHSVSAFRRTRLADDPPPDPVIVKTRSQVNGAARELVDTFPASRFVYVTREPSAWARSTFRAFALPADRAAGRLLQGVRAAARLVESGADALILSYEAIVADPPAAVASIIGRAVTDAERAAMAATMARDSQAGTGLSRSRIAGPTADEEAWIAEFDRAWAAIRPAALIDRAGLDI